MASEDFAPAIQHFGFVQSLEGEINDTELLAISNSDGPVPAPYRPLR
jgi:hypothetical protein